MFNLSKLTVLSCVILGWATTTPAADVTASAAEKAAMRMIDARAQGISTIAYPTVTFTQLEYDGGTRFEDGSFCLTYTFRGSWQEQRGFFTQAYSFTKEGKLYEIRDRGKSWVLAPFDEWALARALIAEIFKTEIDKDARLRAAIQGGSGKAVVIAGLNAALGF